ncbi:hypothetical protein N7540_008856 [Penicillium herquei]|nr:hypothetical protein N7540_008856 [Penicillium herquei]
MPGLSLLPNDSIESCINVALLRLRDLQLTSEPGPEVHQPSKVRRVDTNLESGKECSNDRDMIQIQLRVRLDRFASERYTL